MITIQIHEENSTINDMAWALERIATLVREGYKSGYDPNWEISGDEEPEDEE